MNEGVGGTCYIGWLDGLRSDVWVETERWGNKWLSEMGG